jgi:hypothetical protein
VTRNRALTVFDRRALPAVFVGIGMALTIGVSFLLIIPIEPIYWLLSIPAGLLIGYYANTRAGRGRGEWVPILGNGLVSGLATGLTLAALLLGVKALFFTFDGGYPDFNRTDAAGNVVPPTCATGGDCVYQRYLKAHGGDLAAAGITDAESFGSAYWSQQREIAGLLVVAATGFGLLGGLAYGASRRPTGAAPAD